MSSYLQQQLLASAHAGDFDAWNALADMVEESNIGDLGRSLVAEHRRRATWYPKLLEMIRKAAHIPDRSRFVDTEFVPNDICVTVYRLDSSVWVELTRCMQMPPRPSPELILSFRLSLDVSQALPDPFKPLDFTAVDPNTKSYLNERLNDICFCSLVWHVGCLGCDGTGWTPAVKDRPSCKACLYRFRRLREMANNE